MKKDNKNNKKEKRNWRADLDLLERHHQLRKDIIKLAGKYKWNPNDVGSFVTMVFFVEPFK